MQTRKRKDERLYLREEGMETEKVERFIEKEKLEEKEEHRPVLAVSLLVIRDTEKDRGMVPNICP